MTQQIRAKINEEEAAVLAKYGGRKPWNSYDEGFLDGLDAADRAIDDAESKVNLSLLKLSRLSPGSSITLAGGETCEVRASSIEGAPAYVRMVGAACIPMVDALPILRACVEAGAVFTLAEESEG